MSDVILGIYPVHPDIPMPEFATMGAACFDLAYNPHNKSWVSYLPEVESCHAIIEQHDKRPIDTNNGKLMIMPGDRVLVPTGMIFDIPKGYHVKLHVRSSVGVCMGLTLAHGTGIIDNDYTGEVYIPITNNTSARIALMPGQRLAQAELVKSEVYLIQKLNEAPGTKGNRKQGDSGGLGSTGK